MPETYKYQYSHPGGIEYKKGQLKWKLFTNKTP